MTEENIKSLIKKRGIIKASITRISVAINQLESSDKHFLQIKLRNLKELAVKYDDVQTQIECLAKDSDVASEDRNEIEDILCSTECKILSSLETNGNAGDLRQINGSIQLKPIKIPHFSGNVLEWEHYHAMFSDLVHSRTDLTNVQRLHYLHSSLSGEPLDIVKNLPINNENYEIALDLLKKRYDNKLIIAMHHVQNILKINKIDKESLKDMSNFANIVMSSINSLDAMKLPINIYEIIIIHFLSTKLDPVNSKDWTEKLSNEKFPNFKDFIEFINNRRQILENTNIKIDNDRHFYEGLHNKTYNINKRSYDRSFKRQTSNFHTVSKQYHCLCCGLNHTLYSCDKFHKLSCDRRKELLLRNKCCVNCMRVGHNVKDCQSKGTCKHCHQRHHSLIHGSESNPTTSENTYRALKLQTNRNILLSTALVDAIDQHGIKHTCRILLDSASQANFCTSDFARKLNLNLQRNTLPITGINNAVCQSDFCINIRLISRYENFNMDVNCAVLPCLTDKLPSESFNVSYLNIPEHLFLADPNFNISQEVDILLGAQFYLSLMRPNQFCRHTSFPIIQETKLGYIISGALPMPPKNNSPIQSFAATTSEKHLSTQIEGFWNIEEIPSGLQYKFDSVCEKHFRENTTRDGSGRFMVSLPRKASDIRLGDSYANAKSRFLNLEQKFRRNPAFKAAYSEFITEYLDLGHMSPLSSIAPLVDNYNAYYLPHHAVFKHNSPTTKLRVVFDGSAKATSGLSLNDILLVGPNVQQDLFSIILRFRTHNYVIISDIEKMYRQILLKPSDCNFQRILWRNSPDECLSQFILKTLTYGTASASFLATRCLIQVGLDNETLYPIASKAIINDFYVDDLITGANTIEELQQLKGDINNLLNQYGFYMHEWFSNIAAVASGNHGHHVVLSKTENIRTLGILWNNVTDKFTYEFVTKEITNSFTKRTILATIAGIYDPLGLIGPVVFLCKHFMQQLWLCSLGWDDQISEPLLSQWHGIYSGLESIKKINIERSIKYNKVNINSFQLHGFADASNKGYACCIYVRILYSDGNISSKLLCSKSRVAPLKQISLPRSELCACLLLSRLAHKVTSSLDHRINEVHLYSDSMVALYWIHGQSARWKTFVANRVSEIQTLTHTYAWHHVCSQDNPSDIISRGCLPDSLCSLTLWWHGPKWLYDKSTYQQPHRFNPERPPSESAYKVEEKQRANVTLTSAISIDLSKNFSSLSKLINVFSYCFRYIQNSRSQAIDRASGYLTVQERSNTLNFFIRQSQLDFFNDEINALKNGLPLSKNSKLLSLNPLIDDQNMLRVGGRLQQASLPYTSRHPPILHPHAHITRLIIESEHLRLLHSGAQLTHCSLRQRLWIINGKVIIRSILRKCLKCFRFTAKGNTQLLGQLPSHRVNPSRPFSCCAVDYGGPFMIRHGGQRSKVLTKSYVSLFICMATKAIHLELVSDLTADSFIAALKRFISRRGLPHHIYSDNGTNFRATRNILHDVYKSLKDEKFQSDIQAFLTCKGVNWTFIPPSSPHFGGLWESGIKSFKYHLRRVVGQTILNYEELYTVITQIEACLNSRPLSTVSNDSRDPEPLTPGHFLIGSPLTAIPDPDLSDVPITRLGRWQLLQKCVQSIWKRWSRDYLHQLQQRYKWKQRQANLSIGDLVLLCEDNTPPLSWKSGIVTDTHTGPDGLVRVVDIRTPYGKFRRPIHKLCLLPIQDD